MEYGFDGWMAAARNRRRLLAGIGKVAALGVMGPVPFALAQQGTPQPSAVVETTRGRVRGLQARGAVAFHGIPYAASTAGANRFKPPQPRQPWTGVLECAEPAASAPQPPLPSPVEFAWYWSTVAQSEDCLGLSVYTPRLGAAGASRPVMVWLHGGAFSVGAGTAPGFDGTPLASTRDVVVVNVNHRLNMFGFLQPGADWSGFAERSPNAGMLDIVAALQWVKQNIRQFGGDPGNVTVFGQSGGAAKVTALMQMPAAQGLFHRAIVQSGSGLLQLATPQQAGAAAAGLLKELALTPQSAHQLRELPAQQLLEAMIRVNRAAGVDNFRPVLDGLELQDHPLASADRNPSARVPMLAGTVDDEATFALSYNPANFSLTEAQVARRVGRFLRIDPAAADDLIALYRSNRPGSTPTELLSAIATDYQYRLNTTTAAELKSLQGGAPAYLYIFDWLAPARGGILGTPHTSEVPFLFGTLDAASALTAPSSNRDQVMRTIMDLWVAFARSGVPSAAGVPTWQPYTPQSRATMRLGDRFHLEHDSHGDELAALRKIRPFDYGLPVNFAFD